MEEKEEERKQIVIDVGENVDMEEEKTTLARFGDVTISSLQLRDKQRNVLLYLTLLLSLH